MKYHPVYIEWIDSMRNHESWPTDEDAKEWAMVADDLMREVGFLIDETEEYALMAPRINPQFNKDGSLCEVRVDGLMKIPKGIIKKMEKIRISSLDS